MAIRPDVLVKGGDYRPDEVVGRDQVEAAGGRLVLIPLVAGHSTTTLVHRATERAITPHAAEPPLNPHIGRPALSARPLPTRD
jgi:D-beta-D-heptose 7-phosphate kinase/D-beta-D-heptose 1-phosphate adenosyltransferase